MTKFVVEGNDADGQAVSRNVPVLVGGVDGSGNVQTHTVGTDGSTKVDLSTLIAGEDQAVGVLKVEQRFSFTNLAANATTVVKSGAGLLHSITINTKGASANVVTVYDNTAGSGTKIATIDSTAATGSLRYDVSFATGLTVVLATGTAADITVAYR